MTQINTIAQKSHRHWNSSLESGRQLKINLKKSIPGNRKISFEQNIVLLDKTAQSKSNKNNRTNKNKTSIPSPTVHKLINEIYKRKELMISKISDFSIPTTLKQFQIMFYNYKLIIVPQQHLQYLKTNIQNFPAINFLQLLIFF